MDSGAKGSADPCNSPTCNDKERRGRSVGVIGTNPKQQATLARYAPSLGTLATRALDV